MNRPLRLTARPARGMALLVVLLILSVMTIIASSMSARLQLDLRRTGNLTAGKQAWWYAMSAEALVIKVLNKDFKDEPTINHLGQNWARKENTFPVDGGMLRGSVTDEQACFNLNSLSVAKKEGENEDDPTQLAYPVKVFRELLKQLDVEEYQAAQLTDALRDWTDDDTMLVSSLGAEDAYYEGLNPPYLTANQWMVTADELRAVRDVDSELFAKLLPHVCALPNDQLKININTLDPEKPQLLAALYLGNIDNDEATRTLSDRPEKGWKEPSELAQALQPFDDIQGLSDALVVKSNYFKALVVAEVGDSRAWLETHFTRSKDNKLIMLRRLNGAAQ
ncbi:MAG: type II secretion system minor pseudopilin GspK [Aeromonas sp.]